ncbi:MAG: adenosylcobinamide-GDP ribazoletransferase [Minwuia sp.]|nr:adenosylcobinamide-GDP ribazoletransferase [Minwuia sp.]
MSTLTRLNADLSLALGWLTRLPVAFPPAAGQRKLAQALWAFPLIGLLLASAMAACFSLLTGLGASPLLAAVVTVTVGALLTGALHEDGLADMLDGLGARGGQSARLTAMRDSRIGAYGVLGLIIILLVRIAALADLPPLQVMAALASAMALGRAAMAVTMTRLPLARAQGAAAAAGLARPADARRAVATGILITVIASGLGGLPVLHMIAVIAVGGAALWLVMRQARSAFGGYSGDILGATCAVTETAVLLAWSVAAG